MASTVQKLIYVELVTNGRFTSIRLCEFLYGLWNPFEMKVNLFGWFRVKFDRSKLRSIYIVNLPILYRLINPVSTQFWIINKFVKMMSHTDFDSSQKYVTAIVTLLEVLNWFFIVCVTSHYLEFFLLIVA